MRPVTSRDSQAHKTDPKNLQGSSMRNRPSSFETRAISLINAVYSLSTTGGRKQRRANFIRGTGLSLVGEYSQLFEALEVFQVPRENGQAGIAEHRACYEGVPDLHPLSSTLQFRQKPTGLLRLPRRKV